MRAAYAWACLPTCLTLFVYRIPVILYYEGIVPLSIIFPLGVADFVLEIWNFFLILVCLSAAHRYTAWNALNTAGLCTVILLSPVLFYVLFLAA